MTKMDKIISKLEKLKTISNIRKATLIYFIVLLSLLFCFLIYVRGSLLSYENNQIDTYMDNIIKELSVAAKKEKISQYVDLSNIKVSPLEQKEITFEDGYKNLFENAKITYKKVSEDKNSNTLIYEIRADSKKIFDVSIVKGKKLHRMGILTFNLLSTKSIKANIDRGIYFYDITVPDNFKVKINGQLLSSKYITSTKGNDEFERMKYITLPENVTYQVNNLVYKPTIEIINNNAEKVSYKEENGKINNTTFYETDNKQEAMSKLKASFDPLALAEKWSLFLTNDLSGTKHGFSTLESNLVKDSYMWDMAYSWATGVDITFVSKHTLKNPTFTNESVKDYVIYNENAFSCVIHLEKNMVVLGNTKIDTLNDRLYFIYLDDKQDGINNPTWRLVNMQNIATE